MILAKNYIIPSKDWYHNPALENDRRDTVAIILINNGILPPKYWEHIIDSDRIYNYSFE